MKTEEIKSTKRELIKETEKKKANKIYKLERIKTTKRMKEVWQRNMNPLETKCRLFYLNTQFVPRSKHFSSQL